MRTTLTLVMLTCSGLLVGCQKAEITEDLYRVKSGEYWPIKGYIVSEDNTGRVLFRTCAGVDLIIPISNLEPERGNECAALEEK